MKQLICCRSTSPLRHIVLRNIVIYITFHRQRGLSGLAEVPVDSQKVVLSSQLACDGVIFHLEHYLRPNKKISVRLKKALYGCVQSTMLWLGHFLMTLDHKAAYLNVQMKGAPVDMLT